MDSNFGHPFTLHIFRASYLAFLSPSVLIFKTGVVIVSATYELGKEAIIHGKYFAKCLVENREPCMVVMNNNYCDRGQTAEARRTTILQPVEQKPQPQKDRQDEKAEGYVPDEGTR